MNCGYTATENNNLDDVHSNCISYTASSSYSQLIQKGSHRKSDISSAHWSNHYGYVLEVERSISKNTILKESSETMG